MCNIDSFYSIIQKQLNCHLFFFCSSSHFHASLSLLILKIWAIWLGWEAHLLMFLSCLAFFSFRPQLLSWKKHITFLQVIVMIFLIFNVFLTESYTGPSLVVREYQHQNRRTHCRIWRVHELGSRWRSWGKFFLAY